MEKLETTAKAQIIDSCEAKEAEIDLSTTYSFPNSTAIIEHRGGHLAIHGGGASWLVLGNDAQLHAFKMLQEGKTIGDALAEINEDDVANVVMQIEAKRFCAPPVSRRNEKSMYVMLTNRCNQRCKHCFMHAGDVKYDELTISQWSDVLDSFKANNGTGVTFTGGEITVYDGYEFLIKYAHDIGLSVTILTNGILWTQHKVNELSPYIDEIQVSIDGYDTSSYYAVRQHDGFRDALSCIEMFHAAGTKVSMAVTPLMDDLDVFATKFEEFARQYLEGHPDLFIKLNLELLPGRKVNYSPEDNIMYKNKVKRLVERLYPNYYIETFVLNFENHSLRTNCGFGEISIAPNGDIYWCNRIHELHPSANALTDDFEKIMQLSEKVAASVSVENTEGCMDCEIRYICGGGCRLEYQDIKNASSHLGTWNYACPGKAEIYDKMIFSNEYFFE